MLSKCTIPNKTRKKQNQFCEVFLMPKAIKQQMTEKNVYIINFLSNGIF